MNQASNDTIHHVSDNTVHCGAVRLDTVNLGTVYPDTVYSDTVHPAKHNTTCEETEKVEVLILSLDKNGVLRDEEGRTQISIGQFLDTQGTAIHDDSIVAEREDFELKRIYITLMRQHPVHGYPHEKPMDDINIFEELVSFIFNEVLEDYHFYKLFPYSLDGDATYWFQKLPPGYLKTWNDIMTAFLNNYLYDATANLEIEMEYMLRYQIDDPTMAKRDEYHGSGEPSRVNEAGTGDPTQHQSTARPQHRSTTPLQHQSTETPIAD